MRSECTNAESNPSSSTDPYADAYSYAHPYTDPYSQPTDQRMPDMLIDIEASSKRIFREFRTNVLPTSLTVAALTAMAVALGTPAPAVAQIYPPEIKAVNDQSANILSVSDINLHAPTMEITEPLLSMPAATKPVDYIRYLTKIGRWRDNLIYAISASDIANILVILGTQTHVFSGMYPSPIINGVQYDGDAEGNALGTTYIDGMPYWQYISKDGIIVIFDPNIEAALSVTFPSGLKQQYFYKTATGNPNYAPEHRIQSIIQNDGTQIKYAYESNDSSALGAAWFHVTSVSLINQAFGYCDPNADQCGFAFNDWPSASFSGPATGSAASGQTTIESTATNTGYGKSYKKDSAGRVVGISNLNSYADDMAISYIGSSYGVSEIISNGQDARNYAVNSVPPGSSTLDISSSALGASEHYYFDSNAGFGMPTKFIDRNNRETLYSWNVPDRHINKVTLPGQNAEAFSYDSRFNILSRTQIPKPGSVDVILTEQSGYDASCSNINICNLPKYYIDDNGNRIDWTYTSFGQRESEMKPAPVAGSARPLRLFTYLQKAAYVLNSAGTLASTGQPIWLPASETVCQTLPGSSSSTCDPAGAQMNIAYLYGADGTADSLLLHGKRVIADGISQLTCYGYDRWRHRISETAPNAVLQACP